MNAEMKRKNVLIDCDPGIDDCLALMLALQSPELNVLGITTVCGNVPASQGAKNALKVLKRYGRLDIPVYTGEEHPLKREYISAQDTPRGRWTGGFWDSRCGRDCPYAGGGGFFKPDT